MDIPSGYIKVKFVASPTGAPYNMAYNVGEFGIVTQEKAKLLLDDGVAILAAESASDPDGESSKKAKAKTKA